VPRKNTEVAAISQIRSWVNHQLACRLKKNPKRTVAKKPLRRHLVAWSDCTKEQFNNEFWNKQWRWLLHKGAGHVTAYLAQRDLKAFNPGAVPRQTTAFFEIVNANHAPEDAELADALEGNGEGRPNICSRFSIAATHRGATLEWLLDRKRRR
jgi:hypothetical protein